MKIQISITLDMSDAQLQDWADEYGFDVSEAASDATRHLGNLVQGTVSYISQVQDFTSMTGFKVESA